MFYADDLTLSASSDINGDGLPALRTASNSQSVTPGKAESSVLSLS